MPVPGTVGCGLWDVLWHWCEETPFLSMEMVFHFRSKLVASLRSKALRHLEIFSRGTIEGATPLVTAI